MLNVKFDMFFVELNGWEVKDVYIFEIILKDFKYLMSKKVIYVDKENYWFYYCVGWDWVGNLWKVWQIVVIK